MKDGQTTGFTVISTQKKESERGHFFINNHKKQTILLVSKLLKQFCYLTIRARQGRFWVIYVPFLVALAADMDCPHSMGMEIESTGLKFRLWKLSPVDLSFAYGNRVQWT